MPHSFPPVSYTARLSLSAVLAAFFLVAAFSASAFAADSDGAAVFQVGAMRVNALLDRPGEMDIKLFSGPATQEERRKYMPGGTAEAGISAFLVRASGKNILVDSGYGALAPGDSQIAAQLAEAGLTQDDIDLILLTHMHADHIGGLLSQKKRTFKRAGIAVSKPELDYWMGLATKDPGNANAALAKAVVLEYGKDIVPPFAFGSTVFPGVTALDASGHTPGHSAFLLESEGKKMMVVGDLLHAAALQFPLPDECASFDIDQAKAAAARKRILSLAAGQNIPIAGMHIPFPGVGEVEGASFRFTPRK